MDSDGEYLVVEPHSHLEFTWGFDDEAIGVSAGVKRSSQ